jgi:hypothetical protein
MCLLMHVIRDIAEQAVAATASDPEGGLSLHEIYRLLDVGQRRPQRNAHLANPLNRDPKVFYFRPRHEPLSGEEPVYGQFLSLDYSAHDYRMILEDHDDLASLESSILSGSGILNPFTTYEFAFVEFRLAPYRITYRDREGLLKDFNKYAQYDSKRSLEEDHREPKLAWVGT